MDIKILDGLQTEFPGWVLRNKLKQSGYVNISQKIQGLIKNGYIERIRRDWYCLGELVRRREPSLRYLACSVYSPSAVSGRLILFESGLIPEAVAAITAVTFGRKVSMITSFGEIRWSSLPRGAVFPGTYRTDEDPGYIRATNEKALLDLLFLTRYMPRSFNSWKEFMFDDLRIDEDYFMNLDLSLLMSLYSVYGAAKMKIHMNYIVSFHHHRKY